MTLKTGTMLENRYRISHAIGQGGMGAIYQGHDTKLDIPVAIKENFLQEEKNIKQFEREARILARLHHQNLPRVIDHFFHHGKQYLVMDYVEGKNLWEIITAQKRVFSERDALNYIN